MQIRARLDSSLIVVLSVEGLNHGFPFLAEIKESILQTVYSHELTALIMQAKTWKLISESRFDIFAWLPEFLKCET